VVQCDLADANTATPCTDTEIPDGGWSHTLGTDCDDENIGNFPGNAEVVADGLDQNCDTFDDCYQDVDNDTYGSATVITGNDLDCNNTPGEADDSTDCDDGDATEFPGQVWYADCDNDGTYRTTSVVQCDLADANTATPCTDTEIPDGGWSHTLGTDCDDENIGNFPGNAEVVADGLDQNCDTFDDCYQDVDNDTYGSATVITGNDLDCNNTLGEADDSTDCDDASATTFPGASPNDSTTTCTKDSDGDDYGDNSPPMGVTAGTDCDDGDVNEFPGQVWYADTDTDGFGDPNSSETACAQPSGKILDNTDCDDASATTFPGASPNDSTTTCTKDSDGDDYGDDNPPMGVTAGTDCDDGDVNVFPNQGC